MNPVASAFLAACRDELAALKPGNVHRFADGHRMRVADFEASGVAAAPAIGAVGQGVGARILAATEATWAAVGTNTNLGIVLMAAPLACAFEAAAGGTAQAIAAPTAAALRECLGQVLAALDRTDAELAFRAIARAAPAGLGRAEDHDVHAPPRVTLLEAMQAASSRDRIAHQYATGYADVFDTGLAVLAMALNDRGLSETALSETAVTEGDRTTRALDRPPIPDVALAQATTAVHMHFLAAFPDSHIARKHGEPAALAVMAEARALIAAGNAQDHAALLTFDTTLKTRGLNPGTTADLTVTTLFAARLAGLV